MAGSVNKVILVGNLGKDPEIRRTQDGRPIANLRVATTETWRDKTSGERREKTEWHSVVIFNEGLCRVAEQYLKKGAKVYIEGAAADAQMAGPGRSGPLLARRWCCRASTARSPCSTRAAAAPAPAPAGMHEDDQAGYGGARQRRRRQARRRRRRQGGFDKPVDDEIPF